MIGMRALILKDYGLYGLRELGNSCGRRLMNLKRERSFNMSLPWEVYEGSLPWKLTSEILD